MRRIPLPTAALLACMTLGCGDVVTPPLHHVIATVKLTPHARINLAAGTTLAIGLSTRDAVGANIVPAAGDVMLGMSTPGVATVTGRTLRALDTTGQSWLVATAASGARDSVLVATYKPTGTFHITLQFAPDIPDTVRHWLRWAAATWEQVIVGALPPVTLNSAGGDCSTAEGEPPSPPQSGVETGVRIYVGQSGHYPPGTYVEATGGPCTNRGLPLPTTLVGQIILNRDKRFDTIPVPRLMYLALHEMGHTLGLVGVVQGAQPDWYDLNTGAYAGPMAIEGYRRDLGAHVTSLYVNPGAHWDNPPLWDIMSASGGGPGILAPITFTTVGALMDFGYPATWAGARTFPE